LPYTLPPPGALGAFNPGSDAADGGDGGPGTVTDPITGRVYTAVTRVRPLLTRNALMEVVEDWENGDRQVIEGIIRPVGKNATATAHYLPEGMTATTRLYVITLGVTVTTFSPELTDVKIGDRIDDLDPLGDTLHYRVYMVEPTFRANYLAWLQYMDPDGD
jgi:hypothetical protein